MVSYWISQIPSPEVVKNCFVTSMNKVNLCPGGSNYVFIDNIAPVAREVILVSEDASFYSHNGFDWFEVRNSFLQNVERLGFFRGGSTITQQLAKNLFLEGRKNLGRKVKEAILTIHLERILSKNQIFERYLNVVQFGEKIFGIKQASRHYFQKHPSELNILESAFLAYLLPNPKLYSQVFKKGSLTPYAESRIKDLIRRMGRFKKLDELEVKQAQAMVSLFPWTGLSIESSDDELTGEACAGQICEDYPEEDEVSDAEEGGWVELPDEEESGWDESVGEGQSLDENK
jgi:monofunctional glycosyltransferase